MSRKSYYTCACYEDAYDDGFEDGKEEAGAESTAAESVSNVETALGQVLIRLAMAWRYGTENKALGGVGNSAELLRGIAAAIDCGSVPNVDSLLESVTASLRPPRSAESRVSSEAPGDGERG
jgi:hypothetical protein